MKKGEKWSPEMRAASEARVAAARATRAAWLVTQQERAEALGLELPDVPAEEEPAPEVFRPDGSAASVPQTGAEFISRSEIFMARMRGAQAVTTQDDVAELGAEEREVVDGGAGVTHTSAGLVWMFKKEMWGWHRIKVSRNSVVELVGFGFLDRCGACGKTTCPGQINECEATPKVMYRDCPVNGCNDGRGKRFFDTGANLAAVQAEQGDPFAIRDEHYADSTPATRTAMMLDEHIRYYHTQEAQARGLMNIQRVAV